MTQVKKKLFKDWFDKEAAEQLSLQFVAAYPEFNQKAFIKAACVNLETLEMNDRVKQFSESLSQSLPADKAKALTILTQSLPDILPGTESVTDGWLQWPLGRFIADYGLPYFDISFTAMIELTQRFSAEFAIRPFMESYPEQSIARLTELCDHPSPHVRRLCSEGSRPLLPWGKKLMNLVQDPAPVWPILEKLKDDPEKYVQKSVANHLNDISKNHPDLVIARCQDWQQNAPASRLWIIRHGLRTLIKDGHPNALALLGYKAPVKLQLDLTLSTKSLRIGDSIFIELNIQNKANVVENLLIDYGVTYVRQKGKLGRKVFKWTQMSLEAGEEVSLRKKHAMRITTVRALYPGQHQVDIQINGQEMASCVFQLKA